MPVAKIHVLEGQYDEALLAKVSSAVQNGRISALGIPPEDFFQILHVLPRNQFLHTPSFLGLNYSDDLILLEITFISGRPKEKRVVLLKALNDAVVAAATARGITRPSATSAAHGCAGSTARRATAATPSAPSRRSPTPSLWRAPSAS